MFFDSNKKDIQHGFKKIIIVLFLFLMNFNFSYFIKYS